MLRLDEGNLQFLIVEDSAHFRMLLRTVLHTFGIRRITEAEGGDAAWKLLQTCECVPDIILTDWNMEDGDGLSLVRRIRTDKQSMHRFVPIIMVSGYTEVHRIAKARDAGVNDFLAKPITARSLYRRISDVIRNPRPYVKVGQFFGPDRRRLEKPPKAGERRRLDSQAGGQDAARTKCRTLKAGIGASA